jgi:hypothetical protein
MELATATGKDICQFTLIATWRWKTCQFDSFTLHPIHPVPDSLKIEIYGK